MARTSTYSCSTLMYVDSPEYRSLISPCTVDKGVQLYQFNVTLRDTNPVVWRTIVVQGNFTLEQLGRVAVLSIGFRPRSFDFSGPKGEYIRGYDPDGEDSDSDSEVFEDSTENVTKEIIISEMFDLDEKKSVLLNLDSGANDDWLLMITLESITQRDKKWYPKCIAGKHACPPENCGGSSGYTDLIKAIKNPNHKDHQQMKEWLEANGYKKFNPTKFTLSSVIIAD